jgi:hypothetical protein
MREGEDSNSEDLLGLAVEVDDVKAVIRFLACHGELDCGCASILAVAAGLLSDISNRIDSLSRVLPRQ